MLTEPSYGGKAHKSPYNEAEDVSPQDTVAPCSVLPGHGFPFLRTQLYTQCTGPNGFPLEKYLQLQTIRYAVKEVNNDPSILPNITLGFQVSDSCRVLQKELESTLWMTTGQSRAIPNYQCQKKNRLAAFIGFTTSTFSILMAHILKVIRYPQISHVSTSSLLSDRTQFPYFLRTAPSDAFQSKGLVQLLLHFQWTWVGMIADSNDYGYQGIQGVRQEFIKFGACVEFLEYVQSNRPDRNIPRIIQTIKKSRAKTVIIFATDVDIILLLDEIVRHNITEKLWVASEGWATSSILSSDRFYNIFEGTIGFAYSSEHIPGFEDYIENFNSLEEPWDGMFWEDYLGCSFLDFKNMTFSRERPSRKCTVDERLENFHISLNNITSVRILYNLYNAVHVIAKAIHDLSLCRAGEGPFLNGSCSDIVTIKPWQVLHYMKRTRVMLSNGRELFFDENGDPPPIYDIVNWQMDLGGSMKQVKVGSYNGTANHTGSLSINASVIQWPFGHEQYIHAKEIRQLQFMFHIADTVKARRRMVPFKYLFQSLYAVNVVPQGSEKFLFQENQFAATDVFHAHKERSLMSLVDAASCSECPWNMWPSHEKDRCLPKPIEYLSYEETLGITLASTSITSSFVPIAILGLLICYKTTPIVRANNFTISCLILISLSLCFLSSLGFIGYPEHHKCLLRQAAFAMVFALCVSCILAKTSLVMIAFRATKPNSDLRRWASPQIAYLVVCMGTIIQFLICTIWLLISPPFSEFNFKVKPGVQVIECNQGSTTAFWFTLGYLSFLALISCLVAFLARQLPDSFNEAKFITFSMLAFLTVWASFIPASLSTSGKYTVAMEIFAIISSSWAILCCLFFPKCYVILFHPHVNSRKHLLGKNLVMKLN
ncbi:extracellular calcium-sensing receptor-like [Dendropsophus ebraccatus]|uniref:extracellular calcium-sensing receptor-like n=1 Tax=Dendropsophus ebraccatus TaxID=150705 RepID=UPI003831EDD2